MAGSVSHPATIDPVYVRTVRQILRVNYAGEYGAIRIYRAQIAISRIVSPRVTEFLEHTIAHEYRHAAAFRALMGPRGTRPCGATFLWGSGGTVLGWLTGLMGRNAMMICTEAVERTVHDHLGKQLAWLGNSDAELAQIIRDIRTEEEGHHDRAQENQTTNNAALRMLDGFVAGITSLLIWCSTYGALTRMRTTIDETGQ